MSLYDVLIAAQVEFTLRELAAAACDTLTIKCEKAERAARETPLSAVLALVADCRRVAIDECRERRDSESDVNSSPIEVGAILEFLHRPPPAPLSSMPVAGNKKRRRAKIKGGGGDDRRGVKELELGRDCCDFDLEALIRGAKEVSAESFGTRNLEFT